MLRLVESLMWLAIAAILVVLLVPHEHQVTRRQPSPPAPATGERYDVATSKRTTRPDKPAPEPATTEPTEPSGPLLAPPGGN